MAKGRTQNASHARRSLRPSLMVWCGGWNRAAGNEQCLGQAGRPSPGVQAPGASSGGCCHKGERGGVCCPPSSAAPCWSSAGWLLHCDRGRMPVREEDLLTWRSRASC